MVPVEACTDGAGKPLTTDQRGEARPVGKGCDVGAFERQVSDVTPTISAIADQTLAAGAEISIGFNVGDETYGSDALKIESSDGKPGVLAEEKLDGKSDKRSITLVAGASSGSTTVTITVTNRDGAQASTTFNVTIKAPVAAVIVTNTADSGAGSLRDAVANAAGAPIQFDRSLNGSTISLQSPINVSVAGGVTIQGPGASQLTIDGGNAVGLFVKDSGDFAISGVTLANGNNDFGGAIRGLNDSGTLTIDACLFLDNHADQYGGAIMSSDALTITNSAFVGNSINWFGGALMSQGNTATILNTTFDSNSAGAGGSALVVYGTATLSFVTITNNVGASAFWTEFQTVTLRNSLVAQNGGGNFHTDSIQAVSGGYNLIDNNNGPFTSDRTDNIGGTIASDAIGDNGGETLTVALEPESAAIDAVPVEACTDAGGTPLTVDQRGFARPAGVACDAGAFERQLK